MMRPVSLLTCLLGAGAAAGSIALALPAQVAGSPIILLEARLADSAADAATVQRLAEALDDRRILHGAALKAIIEARHSRGAGLPAERAALQPAVEEGGRLFIEGEFPAAIDQLERARAALLAHVAALASDPSLRDTLHRALLFLAHAYLRARQPARARERIAEAIRSFPDRDLALIQVHYGPELTSLYRSVRSELEGQGRRGTLTVETEPPGCLVFVDERFVGVSPARVRDLLPGRYRVYVRQKSVPGRVHPVTVAAGESTLRIQLLLDGALRTDPVVSLRFPDGSALERLAAPLAASLGRAVGASSVLLVGAGQHRGRRALAVSCVSPRSGRAIRSALLALDPAPPPDRLRALARFVLDGGAADGLIALPSPTEPAPAAAPGRAFSSARTWKWITLGAALAGGAAGATLLALDGRGTCSDAGRRCPERYDTRLAGILVSSGAALAAAGSGLLFYLDARRRARAALALQPLGLTARISY